MLIVKILFKNQKGAMAQSFAHLNLPLPAARLITHKHEPVSNLQTIWLYKCTCIYMLKIIIITIVSLIQKGG